MDDQTTSTNEMTFRHGQKVTCRIGDQRLSMQIGGHTYHSGDRITCRILNVPVGDAVIDLEKRRSTVNLWLVVARVYHNTRVNSARIASDSYNK